MSVTTPDPQTEPVEIDAWEKLKVSQLANIVPPRSAKT